jgi:hypothetical protein
LKPSPFSSDNGGLDIKARIPEEIIFRGLRWWHCGLARLVGSDWGYSVLEKRFIYCVCSHKISVLGRELSMRNYRDKEEIRWQVVKAMLDEFPTLKEKVRSYVTAEN